MKSNKGHNYHQEDENWQPLRKQHGYTLVELLVASAIAGILVVASATDSTKLLRSSEQAASLHQINAQLQYARSHAMASGKNTLVCGSSNGIDCDGQWDSGLLVTNETSTPETRNQVTYTSMRITHGTLTFHSFPANRSSITFLPNGTLDRISNGSFWYCPTDNTSGAKRVTLSRVGQTSRPEREQPRTALIACS